MSKNQKLIEKIKTNNPKELQEFYNDNKKGFLLFLNRYNLSADDALDVYQDAIIELLESEIIIFPSGTTHSFLSSPDSARNVYQFDLSRFDENILGVSQAQLIDLFNTGQICSKYWPKELVIKTRELLDKLFETTYSEMLAVNYFQIGYLMQLIGLFIEELPREYGEKKIANHPEVKYKEDLILLNKIFDYIETHFQEDITLETISALVGFSPYYFTRFFKKHIGQTFIQFLSDYRLDQAKYILSQERLPMIDVAEKSGFSSVKTFHHVFKKSQGISPLQYQKQLNKTYKAD